MTTLKKKEDLPSYTQILEVLGLKPPTALLTNSPGW